MSTSNAAAGPSTSDYTQIFCPAINNYNKLTGQDLNTHCADSAASDLVNKAAVLKVFRDRMQGFDEFRNGNEILMTCLESIVDILLAISTKLNLGESADSEIVSVKAFLSYRVLLKYLFLSCPCPRKQFAPLSSFSSPSRCVSSNDSLRAFS